MFLFYSCPSTVPYVTDSTLLGYGVSYPTCTQHMHISACNTGILELPFFRIKQYMVAEKTDMTILHKTTSIDRHHFVLLMFCNMGYIYLFSCLQNEKFKKLKKMATVTNVNN
jgi:hypothetical protein